MAWPNTLVDVHRNGVCCRCGYSGEEETDCPARGDHTHCVHWWEGPDGDVPESPSDGSKPKDKS